MNPVNAVHWSWRALRGHSVTFAGLFASAVLGVSILAGFRHVLTRLGAPWYLWFIGSMVLVGYFARKEQQWIPEPERRRWWARRVLFGSIVLALALAWLRPAPSRPAVESRPAAPAARR